MYLAFLNLKQKIKYSYSKGQYLYLPVITMFASVLVSILNRREVKREYGHRDFQTNSAQRAKLVKIGSQEDTKFFVRPMARQILQQNAVSLDNILARPVRIVPWKIYCVSVLEQSCVVWGSSLTQENIENLKRTQKNWF